MQSMWLGFNCDWCVVHLSRRNLFGKICMNMGNEPYEFTAIDEVKKEPNERRTYKNHTKGLC